MKVPKEKRELRLSTRAIHVGSEPEKGTGAVVTPIYATSTYAQKSPGVHQGYEYSRSQNPTREALERCVASLEGGAKGFAFASGLAAEATILELLPKDAHLIAVDDLYGGTFRLFDKVKKLSAGLSVSYLPISQISDLSKAVTSNTKMIWIETPTNPLLQIIDLEAAAAAAKKHGLISVADNTFASPAVQQPLRCGFDIVVHSSTKYLGGHSDVVGGVAVVREEGAVCERIGFLQNAVGAIAGPFDSFLTHRGVKTLELRMERHSSNAMALAEFLAGHRKVSKVIYPGLDGHPQHALAKKQMRLFGGMISIVLKADLAGTKRFLESVRLFTLAESLGGVESLIEHPAIMTHASVPKETREKLGIVDSFVRISVGLENIDDLKNDISAALDAL